MIFQFNNLIIIKLEKVFPCIYGKCKNAKMQRMRMTRAKVYKISKAVQRL